MKQSEFGFLIILLLSQSGCSLFFGNVKPVEEKSTLYQILDLSLDNPDWTRLDSQQASDGKHSESHEGGVSDAAFQSQKTAAIISINSACKTYPEPHQTSGLRELTRELLLGISEITFNEEKTVTLVSIPALQTTLQGKLSGENMMLRTVVFQKGNCVYDLMYVTRPHRFKLDETVFTQFVSSFQFR